MYPPCDYTPFLVLIIMSPRKKGGVCIPPQSWADEDRGFLELLDVCLEPFQLRLHLLLAAQLSEGVEVYNMRLKTTNEGEYAWLILCAYDVHVMSIQCVHTMFVQCSYSVRTVFT